MQKSLLCDVVIELAKDDFYRSQCSAVAGDKSSKDKKEELEDNEGAISLQNRELNRAIFLFIIASIKDRVGGNTYKNPLLCFCAALSITKRPLSYTEPHLYTGILAAVL